jgi:methyl-accepting chemotaxis protein
MASTDTNMDRNKRVNLSKTLVDEVHFTANETDEITDDIPVTIFRASYGSSGTTIRYLSNNVEELTGYSKTDFLNNRITLDNIIFPVDIQNYNNVKQKAIKNKTSYKIEFRLKKADGSTVFVQEQARPVCDDKGNTIYIDGVLLDVTQEEKKYDEYQSRLSQNSNQFYNWIMSNVDFKFRS